MKQTAIFLCAICILFAETSPASFSGFEPEASPFDSTITPTFFSLVALSDWIPDGGAQVVILFPKTPIGYGIDPGWSGSARPNIFCESTVDMPFLQDPMTGLPIETIASSASMGLALLRASGSGYFSISAKDNLGLIKPSMPLLFEVIPSGTSAIEWQIHGPSRMNYPGDFSIHWAVAADFEGRPVPSAFPGLVSSVVRVRIAGESRPDSSARVANAFDRTPVFEASLTGFYGIFPFIITNDQPETVTVVAEDLAGTLAGSDTFEVVFLPGDDPANLLIFPANGIRVARNTNAGLVAMAFSNGFPDPVNYSTRVRISSVDLSGAPSVSITPSGWQTLIGGVAGFTFRDTEADTNWVFFRADIDSTPLLFAPIKTPIQVVPEETAIKLDIECPSVGFPLDSIPLIVSALNSRGEIDNDCAGWFILDLQCEGPGAISIIDSLSGEVFSPSELASRGIQLNAGRRVFTIYEDSGATIEIQLSASDAEIVGLFDNGMLLPGATENLSIGMPDTGAVAYSFVTPSEEYFRTGEELIITVTARTGMTSLIDRSYYGSASISVTGGAFTVPSDGIIDFHGGIATFALIDTVSEAVDIEVSGPLFPDTLRVRFVRTGVMAYSQDYNWIPLGAQRNMRMAIFNETFIATEFCGPATISAIEPDGDASAVFPTTVDFVSGIGFFPLSNSDAEIVTVFVDGGPDVGSTSFILESRARVNFSLPPVTQVAAALDTILFELTDFYGAHYSADCTITIDISEQFENTSVSYENTLVFEDGSAVFTLENSEPESIWLHVRIPEGQLLYMDSEEIADWEYYIGALDYVVCDIEETDLPRTISLSAHPNPFNSAVKIVLDSPSGLDASSLEMEIFDIAGRIVARTGTEDPVGNPSNELSRNTKSASTAHEFIWHPGESHGSGVYFVRVSLPTGVPMTIKAVYLK